MRALLLVLNTVVALAACGNTAAGPATSSPPDAKRSDPADAAMSRATVVLGVGGSSEAKAFVTLARTEMERQRGLMYVQNLPVDDGMLFIFDFEADQEFWMKNTVIPLDMIFIKADRTVAGVVANAPPLNLTPRGVGVPSQFVLEMNGGWAAAHGVAAGTKVRFDNISGL